MHISCLILPRAPAHPSCRPPENVVCRNVHFIHFICSHTSLAPSHPSVRAHREEIALCARPWRGFHLPAHTIDRAFLHRGLDERMRREQARGKERKCESSLTHTRDLVCAGSSQSAKIANAIAVLSASRKKRMRGEMFPAHFVLLAGLGMQHDSARIEDGIDETLTLFLTVPPRSNSAFS